MPGASGSILPGSYEFTLESTEITGTGWACWGLEPQKYVSPARLDLSQNAQGAWHAVVAFTGQAPAAFAVTETPTGLILQGSARGPRSSPLTENSFSLQWKQLEITKGPGNDASALIRGEGEFHEYDGGDGWCAPNTSAPNLKGAGTLSADTTRPTGQFSASLRPGRRGEVLLPWDPIVLHLSEPLTPAALQNALSASASVNGTSIPIETAWHLPTTSEEAISLDAQSAGTHWLQNDGPWPSGAVLQLSLAAGASDPSGNAIEALSLGLYQAVDAGSPATTHELDEAPPGLWGDAVYLVSSAECESGGCVELSASSDVCPLPLAGLAARLTVPEGAKQLNIRFRLFVDQSNTLTFTPAAHVALHTGVSASEPAPLTAGIGEGDLQPLTPEDPTLKLATGWRTFSTPLPELGADRRLDIDLFKGTTALAPDCIFAIPNQLSRLLVDRIWAD